MKPANKDKKQKADLESLEHAIQRERLIDWLVNVSTYIHWLKSKKKNEKSKEDK